MKAGLSRNLVLGTARELVLREGIDALSMRRLGELLGVEAMALYRHVRNKEELLDALRDEVIIPVAQIRRGRTWRSELRLLAHASRDALRRSPSLAPLFATRPALTESTLPLAERVIAALAAAGLPRSRQLGAYESLLAFVVGHVLIEIGLASHDPQTLSIHPDQHPHLTALSKTFATHSSDASFDSGLELLLHGIERMVTAAKTS